MIYRGHIQIKVQLLKKYIWNHKISNSSSSAIKEENGVNPALDYFHCCLHAHWRVILCRKSAVLFSEDSAGGLDGGRCKGEDQGKEGQDL